MNTTLASVRTYSAAAANFVHIDGIRAQKLSDNRESRRTKDQMTVNIIDRYDNDDDDFSKNCLHIVSPSIVTWLSRGNKL